MSSVPHLHQLMQDPAYQEAVALAARLTPTQRHYLAQAGRVRWCDLPTPWQPWPGRPEAVAKGLCSVDYQLLERVPNYLWAYRLTHLGELVTGVWLIDARQDQQEAIARCN